MKASNRIECAEYAQAARLIIDYFVGMADDPRNTGRAQLLNDLSATYHYDAMDDDTDIDQYIQDAGDWLLAAYDDYCAVKNALDGLSIAEVDMIRLFQRLESDAEEDIAEQICLMATA